MSSNRSPWKALVSVPVITSGILILLLVGGWTISSTPEAEVNVSAAAGYQGLADVAADPADPDSLIVAGADDGGTGPTVWSSADGGNTYSSTALPLLYDGHTFAEGSEPAVAVDRDGVWYAVYEVHDLDGGSNPIDSSLVVANSLDGLTWSAAGIIEDNRGAGTDPSVETPDIAVDPQPAYCTSYSDRLHVLWIRKSGTDRMVYRSYSTNEGATWYAPAKINDGVSGTEDVWRPRVAVGPDGRVHAAWLDDGLGAIVTDSSINGGSGWGTDVNATGVSLGCGTGDCGNDLGCSGGARHGSTPALAVDLSWTSNRGAVYIAFTDDPVPANGTDVFVTSSTDSGTTWSAAVQVNSVSTYQQYGPALAVNPLDGALHAAWYDRRADNVNPDCETETWHAVSTDGGSTWTDETAVSSAVSDYTGDARGEGPNLAMDAVSTRAFPVWTDNRASNHEIYLGRIAHGVGTLVPGQTISSDVTWQAADGPFIVTGDQTIDVGTTLTIEAGTEVRIATCDALRSGADANRIEFIVEGILDVQGSSGNEVQIHSGAPSPAKSDWYGLRFQNTSDSSSSSIQYATIAHTRYGMRLSSSSPTLDNVTLELAEICGIEGAARTGVPFSPTSVTVTDAGTPVSLTGVAGTWTDVTLQDSSGAAGTISGNNVDLRLVGMSVLNNAGGGLILGGGGGREVILSEFNGNGAGEAGLTLNGNGSKSLVANDYTNNGGDGLEINNDTTGWPSVALYASNLDNNGAYAVHVAPGSKPVDARRSYWGALDAEMTEYPKNISGIWDIHDDSALRHVDFREKAGSAVANDGDLETYLALSTAMNDNETVIYGGAVARNGVLKVEVSTDGGSTWHDATVEGATFSYVWAPTPGTYTVMSQVTDTTMTTEAIPDQVVVNVSAGPTLAGTLSADETWTGPTPIVLEGDVIVPSGTTLTIDPAAVIHAQYLTDSNYGGLDPSRIEIIVEGVLQSNGTTGLGNEVVWDSSRVGTGASKGDWYGIRYLDTTTDNLSVVKYTEIGHAVNGVKLESAAPDIHNSTISNCSQDGITGDSGSLAKPLWILSDNTIQDNDGDGVRVAGGTEVEVLGAVVSGNGDRGLSIDASPYVVTVTDANVYSNGTTGVWINSGSTGFNLLDSIIQNNGEEGVYVANGGTDIRLERLTVTGNGLEGIYVSGGTEAVILKSTITGNERGLRIGNPRLVAAYNDITGNTGDLVGGYPGAGIYNTSGTGVPAVVGMCDLDSSVDYEVYMTTSRALNARRNWWGATSTTNMNGAGFPADLGEFYDIHQNRGYGVVDYDNWAATSVSGSAPGDHAAHITWPGTGTSMDITSVVLTGVAYARNGIDRVEVCVREQGVDPPCGDGGGETPFGVVTGKEAWTFEWFPPSSATFELQARVVDTFDIKSTPTETITYTVNLLGGTVTSKTFSGPVIANQTWSGNIELTGDVVVEAGNTLTIAAGTTVKARTLADDRLGGEDTSRVELIVRGNLVTQGTGGSPVALTSTRVVPEKRDWYGIRFESTSDASLNDMDWTSVEAGWHGLEFRDTFSALDDVSSINNHGHGLYLPTSSAAFPATATVTGGSFLDNGTHGIYLHSIDGTWTLDGVEMGNNGSRGLYVYTCNADGPLTLDGVNVHGNGSQGTHLYQCNRPVNLLASTYDGNASYGFYATSPGVTTVRYNTFSNNTNTALYLSQPADMVISKNTFTGNKTNAVIGDSTGQAKLVFNEFGSWTNLADESVAFSGGSAAVFRNVHFNNLREYAPATGDVILQNAVASSVNARVNYWDPDTTTEMNGSTFPANISSIQDVEDNPSWGRVDYREHATAAVDLSPPQVCGFYNPVDGDTLTGAMFTLRGAAAANEGISVVDISTDGGSTWNPVTTGAEVWTYDWTPPASDTYNLKCRVTDTLSNVQASPGSITVTVNAANITTSGTLTGDETWSGTIVLTGDVTVPDGITLTIQEGTLIKATPQSDDQFGGVDTSKIELIIEGTLDLQGSAVLPVTFTSDRTPPVQAGDWYGIRLLDTADSTVTIHDTVIEAGVRGIWGYPGSHQDVIDCTVRDMTDDGIFMQYGGGVRDGGDPGMEISGNTVERTGSNDYGIYLNASGTDASWQTAVHVIDNNNTDDTGNYGIYAYSRNSERIEITSNNITDANYGVYVYGSNNTSYTNRVEIVGNLISSPGSWGSYTYTGRDVLIDGNTINGAGTGSGIYTYAVREGRIVRNTMTGGQYDGISMTGSGGSDMYVHRNSVTGYGRDALTFNGLTKMVALYNTLDTAGDEAMEISVTSATAVPRIHWNNIQGSTGYDLQLNSAIGADLKHNYWAGTNGEMIAEGYPSEISEIRDIDDNTAYGRIDYRGVENLPITTAVSLESRIVWPFGGDTMSRRTITLEGTAYADAGVQLVEVSTDGGSSWLPATGADYWEFTFTPTVDGPQTFLCRVTDNDSIVEPMPYDSITVTFDSALPTVEGTLPGNETWDDPVIVLTGDVIVPVGTTLTIDPGTVLQVQPLADNLRGGVDLSRIELIVEGTLDLQGTGASPVTFTSDRTPTPVAGDWYGIRLTDTADSTVTIHDLVVEYGVRGIWGYAGSHHDVIDCTVRDMTDDGIHMLFGNSPRDGGDPGISITGNTVERIGSNDRAIYLDRNGSLASWNDAVHVVDDNTTTDTGSYGIYATAGNCQRLELTNNTVTDASTGIYGVASSSTLYGNHTEITGNQVFSPGGWGIYQYSGRTGMIDSNTVSGGASGIRTYLVRDGWVTRNTLDGGTTTGISLTSSGGNSNMHVHRNSISNYGGDGLAASSLSSLVALYNTISNSGGDALDLSTLNTASVPHIHWNNIQGSTAYDARVRSLIGADIRRNFWSGTNAEIVAEGYPAEISEIYDIEDNTGLGRIDYRGEIDPAVDTNVTLESRFIWPLDGATVSVKPITLEGTAYADAGVQLVEVSTDGGSSWLPATGTEYWTYTFTPAPDTTVEFRCRVTDNDSIVEPVLHDAIDVTFDSSLLTTEGTLPANETWSGTVTLTGDVVIPAGTTLTISPGAEVRVQPLADNSRGGVDWSRIELIVEGDLVAQGTGPGSITFTSDSMTPEKGHWYGIRYDGTARALTELRDLSLEWGMKGLSDTGNVGIPDLDGITIQQMQQDGVRVASAPIATGVWTFRNLDISLADQEGFYLSTGAVDADVVVENSTIRDNGRHALYLDLDPTETLELRDSTLETATTYDTVYIVGQDHALVEGVTIRHPSTSGEALYVYGSQLGNSLVIDDSEITGGAHSVYLYRVTTPEVRRSRISDGVIGLRLQGYSTLYVDAVVENNRISDTSGDGVYIGPVADATLHFNDLYNISGYHLNNQSANDIDAADNYWGEDTETEMNAKGCNANIDAIYDQYDNGSKGLVTYCDYATEPFGDQPTIIFHDNAGTYEIHWNPKGGLTYDLIRGDLANLAINGTEIDLGAVTCEVTADGTGIIVDTFGDPATAGDCFFYLLRDHTTPGTYGQDSDGRERIPASGDCP